MTDSIKKLIEILKKKPKRYDPDLDEMKEYPSQAHAWDGGFDQGSDYGHDETVREIIKYLENNEL